jgi:tripartite-type tricarboxylate transporter receptor subunit TctC
MTVVLEKRRSAAVLVAFALAMPLAGALAQATVETPSDKPIKMIVPNAPGSSVDAVARVIGSPLGKAIGHPIIVENQPGAGGVPATNQIVRAPKDGLTIGMVSNNHVVNPSIYKSMPFDSIKDITPISVVAGSPIVLVAHPSVAAKDMKELIALAKAKPGELYYGSSGNGTILHLAAEAFKADAGRIDIKHVPYKGTGQLTSDLLGGQVQLAFLGVTGVAQHIKAGKLRAIGVTTKERSSILPDVPTLAEQGLSNYNYEGWIALIGPGGLPAAVTNKLSTQVKAALATKEVQEAMAAQGMKPIGSTPEAALQLFQSDLAKYAKVVKESGARID